MTASFWSDWAWPLVIDCRRSITQDLLPIFRFGKGIFGEDGGPIPNCSQSACRGYTACPYTSLAIPRILFSLDVVEQLEKYEAEPACFRRQMRTSQFAAAPYRASKGTHLRRSRFERLRFALKQVTATDRWRPKRRSHGPFSSTKISSSFSFSTGFNRQLLC